MPEGSLLSVEVVVAWPRRHVSRRVSLSAGATVADAVAAADLDAATMACVTGFAVHGERVEPGMVLADGDRMEMLRPLKADPKMARRARAERQRQR